MTGTNRVLQGGIMQRLHLLATAVALGPLLLRGEAAPSASTWDAFDASIRLPHILCTDTLLRDIFLQCLLSPATAVVVKQSEIEWRRGRGSGER
jgi:hypothetical protein